MDAVEIVLLCVVGFSVFVFLVLENLGSFNQQNRKTYDSESKTRVEPVIGKSAEESVHQENEIKSVGADGETSAKQVVSENYFQETGGEETEVLVNASDEKSDFCKNKGINEDDDWEGIERTEQEKIFGKAMFFVSCKSNADKIDENVKLQLYGLQKVALEGPCHGSQPMALNVSARSKWGAWQKLGNMSREMAMEKYINIISKAIPGWKGESTLNY